MWEVKQINIKNRTYCYYNDIINIKNFNERFLQTDKESYKNIGIYNTGYIIKKKIDDCKSIDNVNPLYLLIDHASGYVKDLNSLYLNIDHASGYIKEKDVNKYLVYDSADENKELLKKYGDVLNEIKDKIKEVSDRECNYEKDYMKIKCNSDDNSPLDKPLKFHLMTITIRSVFQEDGKLYPQLFLDDALYELNV